MAIRTTQYEPCVNVLNNFEKPKNYNYIKPNKNLKSSNILKARMFDNVATFRMG